MERSAAASSSVERRVLVDELLPHRIGSHIGCRSTREATAFTTHWDTTTLTFSTVTRKRGLNPFEPPLAGDKLTVRY